MSGNVGTGPGDITPDGCAVDFYALLPAFGEPDIVHAALPDGASILELGCGTGRILRPLAGLGHPVLGVDESPAMLARIPDLPTVCSPIETLRLDQTFGAVLLASLAAAGLRYGRALTPDQAWFTAHPHAFLTPVPAQCHRAGWMPASAMSTTSRTKRSLSGAWPCSRRW